MEAAYRKEADCMIVPMPREVDHHVAGNMSREIDLLAESWHVHRIVFDFAGTDFMDSSGIGVIMGRYQKLRLLGGSVAATHVSDRIWRILHLAGVTKVLEVEKERNWKENK